MTRACMNRMIGERPVGSKRNEEVGAYVEDQLQKSGYTVESLPFETKYWEAGEAVLEIGGENISFLPSPWSKAVYAEGELAVIQTIEELRGATCEEKILILAGELAKEQIQPKDYPFYYPEEHKEINDLLEAKRPAALITLTGSSEMCGLDPFPMFADGEFQIASCYGSNRVLVDLLEMIKKSGKGKIRIESKNTMVACRQLVGKKTVPNSKGIIILGAHMDTQYNTPGALDNGTGLVGLLETAKRITTKNYDVEIVPFNSEESYSAMGEVVYLSYLQKQQQLLRFMVNLDSPFHIGSKTAVSFYNIEEEEKQELLTIGKEEKIEEGEAWYCGDHCAFLFQGIPCIAVSSSDLFTGALKNTHTPLDTWEDVDLSLVEDTTEYLRKLVKKLDEA